MHLIMKGDKSLTFHKTAKIHFKFLLYYNSTKFNKILLKIFYKKKNRQKIKQNLMKINKLQKREFNVQLSNRQGIDNVILN